MRKVQYLDLPAQQFHLLSGFSSGLQQAFFGREGGKSEAPFDSLNVRFTIGDEDEVVTQNRQKIRQAMALEWLLSANQTHSDNVLSIDNSIFAALQNLQVGEALDGHSLVYRQDMMLEIDDYDGFVTNVRGLGLMMQVADCQAALFYDPTREVLAVAHAGWKGLKKRIYKKILDAMTINFGCSAEHIFVGIAPSLGLENSEFTDPIAEIGPEYQNYYQGRKVDLWGIARQQLTDLGIQENRLEIAQVDTANPDSGKHFFSYRREGGKTGRNALVAALK